MRWSVAVRPNPKSSETTHCAPARSPMRSTKTTGASRSRRSASEARPVGATMTPAQRRWIRFCTVSRSRTGSRLHEATVARCVEDRLDGGHQLGKEHVADAVDDDADEAIGSGAQ